MHRSQMTSSERARAKQERDHGTPTLDGRVSYFLQLRGNAPTDEEVKSSVQWNTGVEGNEGMMHRWGPDLLSVLAKLPP
jgi:hypothetical protein